VPIGILAEVREFEQLLEVTEMAMQIPGDQDFACAVEFDDSPTTTGGRESLCARESEGAEQSFRVGHVPILDENVLRFRKILALFMKNE